LKGAVSIPASKSHTIRAVAIASLATGKSLIHNPLDSSDTSSAVRCYRALGAEIDASRGDLWKITGTGGSVVPPGRRIDVANSGTTLLIAMGSAALAGPGQTITFTGDAQTRSRPVGPLCGSLTDLGAKCVSLNNNGKVPVEITGRLSGGKTAIAASTSQYLSSLLLCTPLATKDTEIDVTLLNEPGYAQMTLDWLDKQHIEYENEAMRRFRIKGNQSYKAFDAAVPADFSSATFFLCAAALVGDEVTLLGLDFADSQPDKAVIDYLRAMGADISVQNTEKTSDGWHPQAKLGDGSAHTIPKACGFEAATRWAITVRAAPLHGTDLDMNKTPDALPAMAVTGAFASGTTRLLNVPQARAKETDRIKCMAEELTKMGVAVEELPDGLVIRGGRPRPTELDGRGDHRIVMALSLAGLVLDEPCVIDTAEAISVTFPGYVELMKSIGANIELRSD